MHTHLYDLRDRRLRTGLRVVGVGICGAWTGLLALGAAFEAPAAAQQPQLRRAEQSNMQLVGFQDLQARSAYQPVIRRQGDRWMAYIGHHGGMHSTR